MVHIRRKMGVYIPFCGRYKLVIVHIKKTTTTEHFKKKID